MHEVIFPERSSNRSRKTYSDAEYGFRNVDIKGKTLEKLLLH